MEQDRSNLIWILIAIGASVLIFSTVGFGGYGMMGMMGLGMGAGLLLTVLVIVAIVWAATSSANAGHPYGREWGDSLTILKRRYASGEITKKQYEEMKKDLRE